MSLQTGGIQIGLALKITLEWCIAARMHPTMTQKSAVTAPSLFQVGRGNADRFRILARMDETP
jgi:hypothetical protein